MSTDISALTNRPVVIGGGAAGLMTALQLAPEPVLVVSKAPLGAEASSLWAQGGLAAAMGGDDNPVLHLADTIAAGAGLSEEAIARRIVVRAHRRREATLRPQAGGFRSQRRLRHDKHRLRRQLQRRHQSCGAAADDHRPVGQR